VDIHIQNWSYLTQFENVQLLTWGGGILLHCVITSVLPKKNI